MSQTSDFLNPKCVPDRLDTFGVRQAILNALDLHLENLKGRVLDIGCGRMPYKQLVLSPPSQAEEYIGLDLTGNLYHKPDLEWDGNTIPLASNSVDCALAIEVLEHCPVPERVMGEALRVLKPGGTLFFTVPFLWPLHDVPYDEYRYTPYALERHLQNVGFEQIALKALGGWDASLAHMIGLWVRRRPLSSSQRFIFSRMVMPLVWFLRRLDTPPTEFHNNLMVSGISGTAIKPT